MLRGRLAVQGQKTKGVSLRGGGGGGGSGSIRGDVSCIGGAHPPLHLPPPRLGSIQCPRPPPSPSIQAVVRRWVPLVGRGKDGFGRKRLIHRDGGDEDEEAGAEYEGTHPTPGALGRGIAVPRAKEGVSLRCDRCSGDDGPRRWL